MAVRGNSSFTHRKIFRKKNTGTGKALRTRNTSHSNVSERSIMFAWECLVEARAKVTDTHGNWKILCVSSWKFAISFLVISYTILVIGKRKMVCRSNPSVRDGKATGAVRYKDLVWMYFLFRNIGYLDDHQEKRNRVLDIGNHGVTQWKLQWANLPGLVIYSYL